MGRGGRIGVEAFVVKNLNLFQTLLYMVSVEGLSTFSRVEMMVVEQPRDWNLFHSISKHGDSVSGGLHGCDALVIGEMILKVSSLED